MLSCRGSKNQLERRLDLRAERRPWPSRVAVACGADHGGGGRSGGHVGCLGQTKVAGPDWGMIRKIDFGLFGCWLK
jgi:hypothetical protein